MKCAQKRKAEESTEPTVHAQTSVPKLTGADVELGNFLLGTARPGTTYAEAARAILREIRGVERVTEYRTLCTCASCQARRDSAYSDGTSPNEKGVQPLSYSYSSNAQDWGRKFLPSNGGCVYIDLDHVELCLPEVLSAYDHVAAWHAMLRTAAEALDRANKQLPAGQRIVALVNNSDGQGHSYGSHLDMLVTRRCFDNTFQRKLHHQLFLASYLTSSVVFSGNGKVGSENGQSAVDFQISSRADFFETLTGPQTTYRRPIINSRDENLCGTPPAGTNGDHPGRRLARLHVIFFDNSLMQTAALLKVGVTQIILCMLEQDQMDPRLILDDPLEAVVAWSHDPTLQATVRLASGQSWSALDMQEALLEQATRFVGEGRAEGLVPRSADVLRVWSETIALLRRKDFDALARRLDWVLKWRILDAFVQEQGLTWESPEVKHLDQMYGSLAADDGVYWAYERAGFVDAVVTAGEIERFVHEPPDDTRAWLRAQLLRGADPATVVDVDWDSLRFKFPNGAKKLWPFYSHLTLEMSDPCDSTRERCEKRLREAGSVEAFVRATEEEALAAAAGMPQHREDNPCGAASASVPPRKLLPMRAKVQSWS
jgi:proteasome accessory factor A